MNIIYFDMMVEEVINVLDFFMLCMNLVIFKMIVVLFVGCFFVEVFDEFDVVWDEVDKVCFGGEGIWVVIFCDFEIG